MENIITYITQIKEIVTVAVALIIFIIVSYKQIMAEIASTKATSQLENIAKGLITSAELKPNEMLKALVNKDSFPSKLNNDASPQEKESLVVQSIIERNPMLLKKAQLKDIPAIFNFVGNVYQGIKPLVKIIRKGK